MGQASLRVLQGSVLGFSFPVEDPTRTGLEREARSVARSSDLVAKPCTTLARGQSPPQTDGVRIVIVEDHLMFRDVLRKICVDDLRHDVVGEAEDGRHAVALVAETGPDLVLLDLHLPNLDGFGVVEAIRETQPNVRALVLSSHCDSCTVFRAERARVQGFADKNTNTVVALKTAIAAVAGGRVSFSAAFHRIKAERLN